MAKKTADKIAAAPAAKGKTESLTASVQVLTLPAGLYLFSVKSGTPGKLPGPGGLRLPSLQVGVGPGTPQERVQFMPGNASSGTWLSAPGDLLAFKVHAPGATLLVNSVRGAGGAELAVKLDKLDGKSLAPAAAAAALPVAAPVPAPVGGSKPAARHGLRLQIGTHVRGRGDLNFIDADWAARLGKGYWIESFSVTPLEQFTRQDIEYKGLTASGFESPWLSNGVACGTRGMAIPLIGFAVRLKAGVGNGTYDCEYSGYFQSGVVVGPLKNGTPCLSTMANDPLEGIQVRLVKKAGVTVAAKPATKLAPGKKTPPAKKAPSKPKRR